MCMFIKMFNTLFHMNLLYICLINEAGGQNSNHDYILLYNFLSVNGKALYKRHKSYTISVDSCKI